MGKLFFTIFLIVALSAGCSKSDDNSENPQKDLQVVLYDKDKEAIAYVDYEDEATIYTYEGEPVAYIEEEDQVYGFNGKLLGWFSDGVLYDKTGYAVGAKHGIARGGINTVVTRLERIKGVKHIKPVKHIEEIPSVQPVLLDSWCETSLAEFFTAGKK